MTPSPTPPKRPGEIERAERLVRERNAEKGVQWWERATDLLMKGHFSDPVDGSESGCTVPRRYSCGNHGAGYLALAHEHLTL
jgi:hypothetical protein